MTFKNYISEEYVKSMRVATNNGNVIMEFHKNPKKSDFKMPIGWELKGWLDATTGDLYVFVPSYEKWADASDFEHEDLFKRAGIPNKNKVIPLYLSKNGVDIGEWSMAVVMRYTKGWEKIYSKLQYSKGGDVAMDKVREMAYDFVEDNINLARFFGTHQYKVGSF